MAAGPRVGRVGNVGRGDSSDSEVTTLGKGMGGRERFR